MSCRYKDDSNSCLSCPEYEFCEVPRIEVSYPYGLGYNAGFAEAIKQKDEEIKRLQDELDKAFEERCVCGWMCA